MPFNHLNDLIRQNPYRLPQKDKQPLFAASVQEVTTHHYQNCSPYRTLCDKRGFHPQKWSELSDLPYLPAAIFKDTLLLSVPQDKVFRTISSSATTSGRPSRIGLDQETSRRQSKCFNKVVLERLGNQRRKFIVLDVAESISRTKEVSARSSTIRSLLFCASDAQTCVEEIDGKLALDEKKLEELLSRAAREREPVVIFGFTYILYAHAVRPLFNGRKKFNMQGSKIIHIGGWKKLET